MRKHLQRLERVWVENPVYFITTCTKDRHEILANDAMLAISREVWQNAEKRYGWLVGRYVLMPDHVHFFCYDQSESHTLSSFVGKWKEWTAKYAIRRGLVSEPIWQPEFFDHVLRSTMSYEEKWNYVRQNPVRANLVAQPSDWPFQGEIHDLRFS